MKLPRPRPWTSTLALCALVGFVGAIVVAVCTALLTEILK